MKLETMKSSSTEIYLDAGDMSVTINAWSNHEGAWQGAGTPAANGRGFPVGRNGCNSGGIGCGSVRLTQK